MTITIVNLTTSSKFSERYSAKISEENSTGMKKNDYYGSRFTRTKITNLAAGFYGIRSSYSIVKASNKAHFICLNLNLRLTFN